MIRFIFLLLFSIFILSGCSFNGNSDKVSELKEKNKDLENENKELKDKVSNKEKNSKNNNKKDKIAPFKKAKKLTDIGYGYNSIMEELKKEYPKKEVLLTKNEKKKLFPYKMIDENLTCKAIEMATFYEKIENTNYKEKNIIKSEIKETTDSLSVKVNGDGTITFITSALVESGETEGDKRDIIANHKSTLIAKDIHNKNIISTLTISKKTGLGIRQETKASGIPMNYEVPSGQMFYLNCNLPNY